MNGRSRVPPAQQWIAETESRRRTAEIRLPRSTPDPARTAEEIRAAVEHLNGLVTILDQADIAERRQVYAATGLTTEYDHEGRRARLSSTPAAEVWSCVRVGGASRTPTPRHDSGWLRVSAA